MPRRSRTYGRASADACGAAAGHAVLQSGEPVAGAVVEFSGGPGAWVTKTYSAAAGRGAMLNGNPISVSREADVGRSLLVGHAASLLWVSYVPHGRSADGKLQAKPPTGRRYWQGLGCMRDLCRAASLRKMLTYAGDGLWLRA